MEVPQKTFRRKITMASELLQKHVHVGLRMPRSRRFFGAMFLAFSGSRTKAVARRCTCRVCSIAVWPMDACTFRSRRVHQEATTRHSCCGVFSLQSQKRRSAVSYQDQHVNPDSASSRAANVHVPTWQLHLTVRPVASLAPNLSRGPTGLTTRTVTEVS